MFADDPHDVLAIEVARLAEEGLLAVVVVLRTVAEVPGYAAIGPDRVFVGTHGHVFGVAHGPAGEGSGGGLDVVLAVVADAHGEQFQELTAVILVYRAVVVVVVVEPEDHRRVFRKLDQQIIERIEAVFPEHLDLVEVRSRLVEFRIAGGEESVPEEDNLFLKGVAGCDHAVHPVGCGAVR